MEKSDFYGLLRDFVKYRGDDTGSLPCDKLGTFAVLDSSDDLDSENFRKTLHEKNYNFFWSKPWARAQYGPKIKIELPALIVYEVNTRLSSPFGKQKQCTSLSVMVIDKKHEPCQDCRLNRCDKRPLTQVFIDCDKRLLELFQYLRDVKYYISENKFMHSGLAEFKGVNISEVNVAREKTRRYKKMLETNATMIGSIWASTSLEYYGMAYDMDICFRCPETKDFVPGGHEYNKDCKDC